MRSKDKTRAAPLISSTNSTANAFLGGHNTRPWMLGAASSTTFPAKRVRVGASKSNKSPSTVLPSPAPSDEPSPVQENQRYRVNDEAQVGSPPQQISPQVNTHTTIEPVAAQGHPHIVAEAHPNRAQVPAQYIVPVQPQAPSAKRRKMSSANFPSLKGRLPIIEQYVNSCGGPQKMQNVERQRFRLVTSACSTDDYFYIALHQIFCLWSLNPDEAIKHTIPGGRDVLESSLSIVGQLIADNSGINIAHTKWFATFPNNLSELMHRSDSYRRTVFDVSSFLARLSSDWLNYRSQCLQRGYPPLVDELVNRFGLLSPVFQQVFFTATRRNLGMREDEYSAEMERLFAVDQESHNQIAARYNTAYPPTEREITERNKWQASQYIELRRLQQSQQQQQLPVLRSNVPQNTQPSEGIRSVTHLRHPHTIQTGMLQPGFQTNSAPHTGIQSRHPGPQFPHGHPPTPSYLIHNTSNSQQSLTNSVQWPSQAFIGQHNFNPRNVAEPTARNQLEQQRAIRYTQDQAMNPGRTNIQGSHSPQNLRSPSLPQIASPMQTNPLRSNSLDNTTPLLANVPAGQSLNKPQQQQKDKLPLIPPAGFTPPYQLPQPVRNALHQAHLRSPILSPVDINGKLATKYYQAVQSFAVKPTILPDTVMVSEFSFAVPKDTFCNIAEDDTSSPTAPPLRKVRQGSLQYRLRCCQVGKGRKDLSGQECIVTDTSWPPTIFMGINSSIIEIRRKHHYGKDLPVDITNYVLNNGSGNKNTVRISIPMLPKQQKGSRYAFVIEVVEVFRHQQIIDMCLNDQRITAADAVKGIMAKMSGNGDDDDVALVCSDLTIDLADPFTARIFNTPVRGTHCLHQECFDLETFLTTRNSKSGRQEDPCMVDVWKCPLCGRDARPRSLRIDDFLVSVREKLERDGELETKAILVAADGTWKIKEDALPATKGRSIGRSTSRINEVDGDDTTKTNSRQGSRVPIEIIDIDDD